MSKIEQADVLDILIAFIKGCHYKNDERKFSNCIHSSIDGKDYWIWNADYLLNQLLRQIDVPPERYFLSKRAEEMWTKLKPEGKKGTDIKDYYYRESLTINGDTGESIGLYNGADSKPYKFIEVKKGNKFIFNDIFHLEHTIPIHEIKKKLLSLPENEITKENVDEIINQIYICRMLKSEDRSIDPKYKKNRPFDLERVLKEVYKGIDIIRP